MGAANGKADVYEVVKNEPFNTVPIQSLYNPTMSLPNICFIGIDSPNQTEFIYAQVVRDELGYGGALERFNPLVNTRQGLIDFMRCKPQTMFIIIGSAELAMAKFLIFYKFMEIFQVVSKDGLKALLEYERLQRLRSRSLSPPRSPVSSTSSTGVYRHRSPSLPRPVTPEVPVPTAPLDGATPLPSSR